METLLLFLLLLLVVLLVVVAANSIKVVRQSTVGVLERLGQYAGSRKAGMVFLIPFMDSMRVIDLREQVLPLPPQSVITKENVTMKIDAIVYFQVTDPFKATYEVAEPWNAVEKLALTTMRNIIGEMTLDETLSSRDQINSRLQHILDDATTKWGIKVNRVELKDIDPPKDIEQAMQKEMRAEREKRSQILMAEGEKQAAILRAEGDRESAIRAAEGQKQAVVLIAEGEREASIRRAEGMAESIRITQQAEAEGIHFVNQSNPSREVLQLKYLEALRALSQGKANTLVLPYESVAFMGALTGGVQMVKGRTPENG
jgi:regulator of protease activity HflC (stomatin/prohibitin superfamily)